MDSCSITGRVTRSTRRLSVEKPDKDDELRSAASTPTKQRPTKRLSIKPNLDDVMESDAAPGQETIGNNKLNLIMEENPIPGFLLKDLKKKESLPGSPSRSLRKRTASTSSPEDLKKNPTADSEVVNTKTPKKTMLKKIENSLLQNIVDSPKPRKKRNSIGGSDADAGQELTPLRRSRRLSTELNVVVEDPLREEQSDHVQTPITRRGKRMSIIPLQPSLPEENEDLKESDSTSASPKSSLNVSSSKDKSPKTPEASSPSKDNNSTPVLPMLSQDVSLTRRDGKPTPPITITDASPVSSLNVSFSKNKTPSKGTSTPASPTLIQDVSLTRRDRKSKSPISLNISFSKNKTPSKGTSTPASPTLIQDVSLTRRGRKSKSPMSSFNVSLRSDCKTPKAHTPDKIDSTSASPTFQDVSLTRNDRKSRTPKTLSLNKSELNASPSPKSKSTQDVSPTIHVGKSPKTPKAMSPKSFNQTPNLSKSMLHIDDSLTNNVSSSPSPSNSKANTSKGKMNKYFLESPTKRFLNYDTNEITDPAQANNTSISCDKPSTEVCNLSQNSTRRSPRKNKSIQNMSVDEGATENDMEALCGDSKSNVSFKNISISAEKHNVSTHSLVSMNRSNVDMDESKSISLKKPKGSFKLKLSDNEGSDDGEGVKSTSTNVSSLANKSNDSVTSSTMRIVYTSPSKNIESPNTFAVKSNKQNRKSPSNMDGNNDAIITDVNNAESIATSTPFVKTSTDKSRTPLKNTLATEHKSPESTYETPKRDKTNSFTKRGEIVRAGETSSDDEDGDAMQIVFLDSQASDAGSNYQSGDSMDVSQLEEIENNEIVEKGESLHSESGESDDSYEKNSFICSDEDESINSISSDEDMLEITLPDEDTSRQSSDKSRKLSKSNDSSIWKDEINVLSNSQPGLFGSTQRAIKQANTSLNENKRHSIGSNDSVNTSKRESTTLISTSNKSGSNLSMKMETSYKSLLKENRITQSPKRLSIDNLNNTAKSINLANGESDVLSLSVISINEKTPRETKVDTPNTSSKTLSLATSAMDESIQGELLANLSAGSMSTPNTGKSSETANSDVSQTNSTKKRLSLDKSNNTSKASDSIKEDNALSTSRANSSGFYESNSSSSKLISDASPSSSSKNIEAFITSNKIIKLNSSNAAESNESLENKLEILSKSPANASTSNTAGRTPKQSKKISLDASLSISFGQKDHNKSITQLLNGGDSAKISMQEKATSSPKLSYSHMEVDSCDVKTLNENSLSTKNVPADVSSQDKSMEKRKSKPMKELNSNIIPSKKTEIKFKAAASTEFEVEPVNIERITTGTKRKLEADSLWTCTAGEFEVVKKPKQQPTRSISASDYGSTTSFKIVPLKKTPKSCLLVDTNLESNVVNFKQDMLYSNRCPRKDSSKLLKIQQKLKASKNRGTF